MTPLEFLLSKLPGARKSGSGWSARCPAHDDRHASLSVSTGDDGRVLLRCHAGCDTAAIVAALGLSLADLFPAKPATPRANRGGRAFPSANEAVAALERQLGPRSALWTYHDAQGETVGLVVRWDKPNGKEIRPVARHEDGWHIAAMAEPRPLYHLPEVRNAPCVIVTEGEKCADAARSLGFTATTSAGGSQAANKTDWRPLAGKEVWILPDNDEPGRKYAETVAEILAKLTPAPVVRIVSLPGLPEHGDIVDWIDAHGDAAEPDGMRAEIEALARAVQPYRVSPAGAAPRSRCQPDLVCLADVQPQKVPWLWYGRIPLGRLSLLVGRPGCGKSLVTCDLAARISTHTHWPDPGFDRAPLGDTLLICAEDDPADTIRPRLDAAGANCRRVHLLKAAKIFSEDGNERSVAFDLSNVDLIRDALDRLPDCKLVVVDPIGSYLGGRVDAHRDNEVRSVSRATGRTRCRARSGGRAGLPHAKGVGEFRGRHDVGQPGVRRPGPLGVAPHGRPGRREAETTIAGEVQPKCPAAGSGVPHRRRSRTAGLGAGPARRFSRRRCRGLQGEPGNQTRPRCGRPGRGYRMVAVNSRQWGETGERTGGRMVQRARRR
jgi:putative DNA primase/helicase